MPVPYSTRSRLVNFKQISRQLSLLELLELKMGNKWISVNIDDDDDVDDDNDDDDCDDG